MSELRSFHGRLGVDEKIQQDLLQLLLVTSRLGVRFIETHVNFDTSRSRCEGAKPHCVLDDCVDVDRHIACIGLAREKEKVANYADRPIGFALDQAHRLELLTLEVVFEEQLGEGGDAGERIIELVRDASDELADSGQLFRASEMVRDLAFLGEISDPDHQSDDVVASIPDVAQSNRSREFGPVSPPMDVLANPERLVGWDGGDGLAWSGLRGGDGGRARAAA